jgi:hypothetical protein
MSKQEKCSSSSRALTRFRVHSEMHFSESRKLIETNRTVYMRKKISFDQDAIAINIPYMNSFSIPLRFRGIVRCNFFFSYGLSHFSSKRAFYPSAEVLSCSNRDTRVISPRKCELREFEFDRPIKGWLLCNSWMFSINFIRERPPPLIMDMIKTKCGCEEVEKRWRVKKCQIRIIIIDGVIP